MQLQARPLPNSTGNIHRAILLGGDTPNWQAMDTRPYESLLKADALTKLLILENEFAIAKRRDMPYPRSWAEVNQILNAGYVDGDFNALDSSGKKWFIASMHDLNRAFKAAHRAYENMDAPWVFYDCPCGKPLMISYRQMRWYRDKGLELPVYCDSCLEHLLGA